MSRQRLVASLQRAGLRGTVLHRKSPGFQSAAAVFNQAHQHAPTAIARCADTASVAIALKCARDLGVAVTVRSGGHAHGGQSVGEGALVIDTRSLRTIELAADGRSVRVGGGVSSGDLLDALTPRGLCTVTGFDERVGVSGLLLGGGYGLLSRRHGLACDQLLSAEVVLCDGRVVETNPESEPDLFWALRGAGANFGVVTAMTLRVHPLPVVIGGTVSWMASRAAELLPRYVEFVSCLPRETTLYVGLDTRHDGLSTLSLIAFDLGAPGDAERRLAPLAEWAVPLEVDLGRVNYREVHRGSGDTFPEGHRHSWRAQFVEALSPPVVSALLQAWAEAARFTSWNVVEHLGGAIGDLPGDATAFAHRSSGFGLVSALKWRGRRPQAPRTWQEALHERLAPASIGTYVNYVSPEHGPSAVERAYGTNLPRLISLKRRYDPERVFQGNVTVPAR